MEDFFCDTENPQDRKEALGFVFDDIYKKTRGEIKEQDIQSAKKVLDLAMGRGAVGGIIKDINPACQITGVEIIDCYSGRNLYDLYHKRLQGFQKGDLTSEEVWQEISKLNGIDLAISVGPPLHVLKAIIEHFPQVKQILAPKGICLLVTDVPLPNVQIDPFHQYHGDTAVGQNILLYKKPA